MMKNPTDESIVQRKAQLIAEGAAYRSGIGGATQTIKASLRADSLAKHAIGYLATFGAGLLKGRTGFAGVGLQTALPLLISGMSALSRKPLLKTLVRSALIIGTVGTIVSIIVKKKKAAAAAEARQADIE